MDLQLAGTPRLGTVPIFASTKMELSLLGYRLSFGHRGGFHPHDRGQMDSAGLIYSGPDGEYDNALKRGVD